MSSENKDKDSAHLEELRKRAKKRDQGLNVGVDTILRMRGLLKEEPPSVLVAPAPGTSSAPTESTRPKAQETAKPVASEAAGEKKEKEPVIGKK